MDKDVNHLLSPIGAAFLQNAEWVLLTVISSTDGTKICTITEACGSAQSAEEKLEEVDTYVEDLLRKVKDLFSMYKSYTFTILLWCPKTMEVKRRLSRLVEEKSVH